jgi:hypothetical protein
VPDFEPVTPPFDEVQVAMKPVIALPLLAPAVNDTVSGAVVVVVDPATALTAVGAAGDPSITAGDGVDAALVPMALVALTVHLYVFAVVTEVTVIGAAVAPVRVPVRVTPLLDELHVAVYPVIALPPFDTGAVKVATSEPVAVVVEPDTAFTAVGAPGAVVLGTKLFD